MYRHAQKQILIVIALIAAVAFAAPAAAIEGQNGISVSIAPINPDFLECRETAGEIMLNSLEGEGMHPTGLIPPPLDLSHIETTQPRFVLFSGEDALPAVYDLRLQERVTPVRDQGNYGTCWAFASLASLESTGIPTAGARDYSEKHMVNLHGFDKGVNDGGNQLMATAYLARWTGPVNEEDDPYEPYGAWVDVSPTGLAPEMHVQDVLFLPDLGTPEDAATLKRAVMEHGAVFTSMYVGEFYPYYNDTTAGFYYDGANSADHAVTIVGWNDTYDRNLFASAPPQDGAWIVKNSWGTDFGDEGYFFVSYCDSVLGKRMNAVFVTEDTGTYDAVYQHDPLGLVGSLGAGSETGWFSCVFTADTDEDLRAVSFYAAQYNSAYELYIYLDPEGGPINTSGPAASGTGTIDAAGYRTIPLENPVALSAGRTFSVVVKLTTPGYTYPIPVEYPMSGYSSAATAEPGEGYIRIGGVWADLTDVYVGSVRCLNWNPCLKAFTTVSDVPSIIGIAPDRGYRNQTVQVTNLSGTNFLDGAVVKLARTGQPDIAATGVSVVSPSKITCTVNLTGAAAGAWDVEVTNPDMRSGILAGGFSVNAYPEANFSANVSSGAVPLTVLFSDTSVGGITAWSWTFGDGNASTEQNPVHTYRTPGNYTVNLTVGDGNNSDALGRPDYIIAATATPTPTATATPTPTRTSSSSGGGGGGGGGGGSFSSFNAPVATTTPASTPTPTAIAVPETTTVLPGPPDDTIEASAVTSPGATAEAPQPPVTPKATPGFCTATVLSAAVLGAALLLYRRS